MRVTRGSCDDGPVVEVLEADESVVLYVSVVGERSGSCLAVVIEQGVRVGLGRSIGDRVLLGVFTGRSVPCGEPDGPSSGWSWRSGSECRRLRCALCACLWTMVRPHREQDHNLI
ncbi:hypothetical protein ABT124_38970 [Streptomyces sp. NPDC001982]|uniref:hypothetical protein n=1 Tax=Streptomyces sp. NPDC001982 TaxID=3154405 RepID=UPI003333588C